MKKIVISDQAVADIMQKFTDIDEIYALLSAFNELSRRISFFDSELHSAKNTELYTHCIISEIVYITLFFKDNIDLIHSLIQVTNVSFQDVD